MLGQYPGNVFMLPCLLVACFTACWFLQPSSWFGKLDCFWFSGFYRRVQMLHPSMCVRVCVCCVCVFACMRVCVCDCVCAHVRAGVSACARVRACGSGSPPRRRALRLCGRGRGNARMCELRVCAFVCSVKRALGLAFRLARTCRDAMHIP